MIRIKICGITQKQDAEAAVRYGADAIGFVFAPSPRRIKLSQAEKISRCLPPHIIRVGVFVDQDYREIMQAVETVGLDRIQFHGHETATALRQYPQSRVIKALRPRPGEVLSHKKLISWVSAYLIDAYVPGQLGGTGQLANWQYARALRKTGKPLILSGGLSADNVQEAIKKINPYMIDVSSGVEMSPGIKNHAKMKKMIQIVKICTAKH